MTPHEIIYSLLAHDHDMHYADQLTDEILERIATQGFVVVHASAVVREDGKVTVTRELLESVLEDAEASVKENYYFGKDEPHPALAGKFRRDIADIRALRAEIEEKSGD